MATKYISTYKSSDSYLKIDANKSKSNQSFLLIFPVFFLEKIGSVKTICENSGFVVLELKIDANKVCQNNKPTSQLNAPFSRLN